MAPGFRLPLHAPAGARGSRTQGTAPGPTTARDGLGRHRLRCRTSRCWGLAPQRTRRTRSRPSSTPRSGGEDRGRGRHGRPVLHHEQGRRQADDLGLTLQTGLPVDQGPWWGCSAAEPGFASRSRPTAGTILRMASASTTAHRHRRSAPAAAVQGLDRTTTTMPASERGRRIGLNNTDYDDQGAFDAANNSSWRPRTAPTFFRRRRCFYKIQRQRQRPGMRRRLVLKRHDRNPRLPRQILSHPRVARHRDLAADHGAAHRGRYRRAAGVFPGRGRLLRGRSDVLLGLQDRLSGVRRTR